MRVNQITVRVLSLIPFPLAPAEPNEGLRFAENLRKKHFEDRLTY